MGGFRLREFAEADYPRLAEIFRLVDPEAPLDAALLRREDELFASAGYFLRRLVAEAPGGPVVGLGHAHHVPGEFDPDRYHVTLAVDPAHQRRGIGSALFEELWIELRRRGARLVRAAARESAPGGASFLTRRGFVEAQRSWESDLELAGFDPAPFAAAVERVLGQGITITTYAEERPRDPDAAGKLFALYEDCRQDEPMLHAPTRLSFDEFDAAELNAPNVLQDAWFLAKDGQRYVGMCQLLRAPARSDLLAHGFTAVDRAYRGRGIALALKLRAIERARALGARVVRTRNNSRNAPMLRLNEKLGFARGDGLITFVREPGA